MLSVPEESVTEFKAWLRIFQNPPSKLHDCWEKTYRHRVEWIQLQGEPSRTEILTEWPRYRDADGHSLVRYQDCNMVITITSTTFLNILYCAYTLCLLISNK